MKTVKKTNISVRSIMVILLTVKGLVMNVLAAPPGNGSSSNSAPPLMPNLGEAWNSTPPDVQKWITWIIGIAFLAFIVVAVVYLFGNSIKVIVFGKSGNVAGSSMAMGEAFTGLIMIILVAVALLLIMFVASHI